LLRQDGSRKKKEKIVFNSIVRGLVVALACALGFGSAHAEDIDIYSQNTNIIQGAPNVLIVMDNTANWSQSFAGSTKFAAELTALAQVVTALKGPFNLGLMMFTETGSPNSNTDGGYVRFAIQGMSDATGSATTARECLLKMIGGGTTCTSTNANYTLLDIINDKSNGGKAGTTMGEAYDYFAGLNAYAGNNKVKADPLAFVNGTIAGPQYKAPTADACEKNYIIVLNNGPFSDNSSDTSTATSQLSSATGDTTVINPPDNGTSKNNVADEWTRFLNKVSTVKAITYTLEVGPDTNTQGVYNTALLQSMGRQGKGGYYSAIDAETLLAALTRIFNDIQAVNSVFASSSLPLSSDNSGAFVNQVYMGVFRPDAGGKPRWTGNLKQYQFKVDSNRNLYLADAKGIASAGSSGFAQPDAESFWTSKDVTKAPDAPMAVSTGSTNGSTGGLWYYDSKGSGGAYDLPDGEWVEKGGAAQQLRLAYLGYGNRGGVGTANASTLNSKPARQVYTCTGVCLTTAGTVLKTSAVAQFDATNPNITDAALGTGASATVSAITSATPISVTSLSAGVIASISSIAKVSKVVTVTTLTAHGLAAGDSVTISGTSKFNGSFTISSVPTTTTFKYSDNGGDVTETAGTVTKTSTVATAASAAHGFLVGQRITIAGATPTAFNGVFLVTGVTTNAFTYTLTTAIAATATGTLTATSNTATATAAGHSFSTGDSVTIAGASPAGYNGVWVVTKVDANTFTYSYTTAAPLSAATGTITAATGGGHDTLLAWIRGIDTQNENGFKVNGADTDVRASIHGDVLHSRPVVLNYSASTTSNNVYLFYGGNDGVFRAIKGGQAATDGAEQWAFIPQEFFATLRRLYNNSPDVKYSSTPTTLVPPATPRNYFFDGPVGSYVERNSSGTVTKAYLYISVRRGGRFIYALDVTDPTSPKFLWRKSSADTGFAELGQTWSQPYVAKIKANANPVLIFGAGYDAAAEDSEPPAAVDTMGRAIYVLDAITGTPVWAVGKDTTKLPAGAQANTSMDFAFAADVLVMDRSLDGFADRIYANDVGGNVWRIDIGDASTANWTVFKLATLALRDSTKPGANRKFLFGPDAVFGQTFDAVVVGSGDREHPLSTHQAQNVANRFYMIKDTNTGPVGGALGIVDHCETAMGTSCASANFFDATSGGTVPADATGWAVTLATGEKVVNGPLVTASNVIFGTNQPDTGNTSCTPNLGIARRYDVNFLTGLGAGAFKDGNGNIVRSEEAVGGGFLPSPVSGVVEIDGQKYVFTTDNPLNPGGVIPITINVPQKRFRVYWKEQLE
jgi:type IV pilus assembly protein PilY1